ncbi:MAG: BON domain-containing protein [Dehalococcoidia bacterium]
MASSDHISTSGTRSSASLVDRLKMAYMTVQSIRPDATGATARTSLRLRKTLGADAADIHVTASGGWMELRGKVASREIGARALEITKSTAGVKGVLDFLRVQ